MGGPTRAGERVVADVVSLDADGAGVGRCGDLDVHVATALPSERIVAQIEHVSPHVTAGRARAWARLTTVERASADRRAPVCPGFGRCGGCVLQHLEYAAQVQWKRQRVADEIAKHASLAGTIVNACVPSPRELGYRNQAKYVVGGRRGALVFGAWKPRTHELVDQAGCRVLEPPIDEVAGELRRLANERGVAPFDERRRTGELRYVAVRSSARGQALVTLVRGGDVRTGVLDDALARELLRRRSDVVGVVLNENASHGNAIFGGDEHVLAGDGRLDDVLGGVPVRLSPRAFFQLNRAVAELAYAGIERAARGVADRHTLVDAYGGAGAIGLRLADAFAEVVGIEVNPAAADDARLAAHAAGRNNVRVLTGDAAATLADVARANVIVLNPPRAGCADAVLAHVARLAPEIVVYLSCAPETLARDLVLLARSGYDVESVQPFDMLPHTPHVESLATLRRRHES